MPLPTFTPADLERLPDAFDHDDFIFELKMDGFRALACVDEHETRLVWTSIARPFSTVKIIVLGRCRAMVILNRQGAFTNVA